MPGSQLHVQLFRDSFNTPWGFRLQGGKDLNQPLTVQRVFSNSPAEGELQRGDIILAIGGQDTRNFSHKGAQDAIKHAGGQVTLIVHRPPPGSAHVSPLSPPIVTQRPRAPSLQQPPNMPSRSPYGIYQPSKPVTTPAQRIEPGTQGGVMLNRVQSTLDNITLSPRTPDAIQQNPWSKPQPVQHEPEFYTPTSLLLEQQERQRKQQQQQQQQQHQRQYPPQLQIQQQPRMVPIVQQVPPEPTQQEQEEEGEEPVVPVWERRRKFQGAQAPPKFQTTVRTPKSNPVPTVSRPNPGISPYTNVGLACRPSNQPTQQSTATWQPGPVPMPAHAPPPQNVHYSSSPVKQVQSPVKSAPPSWARAQTTDDDDGTPAWRSSLRTTGVKPWDADLDYVQDANTHDAQRASPQPPATNQQGVGLPGGRDWSQSQVFQFIQNGPKKPQVKSGPATAPKPQPVVQQPRQQQVVQQQQRQQPRQRQRQQPRQQQQQHQPPPQHHQQPYNHDVGISDF